MNHRHISLSDTEAWQIKMALLDAARSNAKDSGGIEPLAKELIAAFRVVDEATLLSDPTSR